MTRLEQLWQFYVEDQQDPFNLYAYALELAKVDKEQATDYLKQLLADKPEYIPAYYQAAVLSLELRQDARWIIEQGIQNAKAQNNRKAQNELQVLWDDLD
jgi:lipoprotein NlpI